MFILLLANKRINTAFIDSIDSIASFFYEIYRVKNAKNKNKIHRGIYTKFYIYSAKKNMKNVFAPIIREKDYLKLWFYRISVFYIIYNLNFLQGFQCKVKHISISLSIIPKNLSIAGETPLKSS